MIEALRDRFVGLFAVDGAEVFARLAGLYGQPHRRYHTLEHVAACLADLDETGDLDSDDRRLIELALWWHDAIYDPTRSDNEALSAELAAQDLIGLGAREDAEETARLIHLTAGHAVEPGDRRGAAVVSIDLAVLGAPAEAYRRYAEQIREEYAFVPDDQFRAGRAAVLKRFLSGRIYPNGAFAERLEAAAHANLQAELGQLEPRT